MESHGRYIHRAAELVNRIKAESGGDAAIPGEERKWLIKAFATRTAIPALPIMEESKLTHHRNILDHRVAIVVDLSGEGSASRTRNGFAVHREENMDRIIVGRNIFYHSIF